MDPEGVLVESATSDADVEIARIEAEKDIALAEIHTESNEARTEAVLEAQAETDDGRDVEWLVAELAGLRGSQETHAAELSAVREQVALLQTAQAETAGLLAGLILSQSTPPPPSDTPPETPPSGEGDTAPEGNTVPEPPEQVVADKTPKTPARRPIVRM
jgi:hypothetical protein